MRIAQTSFQFGEGNPLEVLDTQRILWQTHVGYAEAQYELSVALTELERFVGKELLLQRIFFTRQTLWQCVL